MNFGIFSNKNLEYIIDTYKQFIESKNMYFIHNNILYVENKEIKDISEEELKKLSEIEIREKVRSSNLIIYGGLAFSGYNNEFNANDGIYAFTINREQEINESKKFEKIYNKLACCLKDKNVIIFTHMPKKDWSNSEEYVKNWVYVSGHTHRNYFYDDGIYRIYSDNQLGYHYQKILVKYFYIEYDYDFFSDYEDGIYEISKNEYINFYRGKSIPLNYNREGLIYMLKKKGYYCFIRQSSYKYNKHKTLALLNGGALKTLDINDINYYYDNMDYQIEINKEPLNKYTKYQKEISDFVKKIGGTGTIHGTIVDIDFHNHIFVNPFDGKLTGYYALNIIDKYVYINVPSLLKANYPLLYDNYQKKLKNSEFNLLLINEKITKIDLEPTYFPDTEIYKYSREIKKLQKLNNGILSVWHNKKENLISNKEDAITLY